MSKNKSFPKNIPAPPSAPTVKPVPKPVVVPKVVVVEETVKKASPEDRFEKIAAVCLDLMHGEFHAITHHEAMPIATRMVDESAATLVQVKKFWSHHERQKMCDELAKKHNLS
jgi:hypothetical protein